MLTLMPVQCQSSDGRNAARQATGHRPFGFVPKDVQIRFLHYILLLFSLDFISI